MTLAGDHLQSADVRRPFLGFLGPACGPACRTVAAVLAIWGAKRVMAQEIAPDQVKAPDAFLRAERRRASAEVPGGPCPACGTPMAWVGETRIERGRIFGLWRCEQAHFWWVMDPAEDRRWAPYFAMGPSCPICGGQVFWTDGWFPVNDGGLRWKVYQCGMRHSVLGRLREGQWTFLMPRLDSDGVHPNLTPMRPWGAAVLSIPGGPASTPAASGSEVRRGPGTKPPRTLPLLPDRDRIPVK